VSSGGTSTVVTMSQPATSLGVAKDDWIMFGALLNVQTNSTGTSGTVTYPQIPFGMTDNTALPNPGMALNSIASVTVYRNPTWEPNTGGVGSGGESRVVWARQPQRRRQALLPRSRDRRSRVRW
jgi:hypothetical protein